MTHAPLPLMLPGYPFGDTPKEQLRQKVAVRVFQQVNGLVPDGDPGPLTRAKLWPPIKEGSVPTLLQEFKPVAGAAVESQSFIHDWLEDHHPPGLAAEKWLVLFEAVSSNWGSGCDTLTTEDGVTTGCRRWAASGLRGLLKAAPPSVTARAFVGVSGLTQKLAAINGAPTGGYPLSIPGLRAGFLALANDREWWTHQARYSVDEWRRKILDRYTAWRLGRTIVLAARAANSAPSYIDGLPQEDAAAYREMVRRYGTTDHRRGRIERVEKLVGAVELWR